MSNNMAQCDILMSYLKYVELSMGIDWDCEHYSLTSLPDQFSFLFLDRSCLSQGYSLITILNRKLCLKVCFTENPTCDSSKTATSKNLLIKIHFSSPVPTMSTYLVINRALSQQVSCLGSPDLKSSSLEPGSLLITCPNFLYLHCQGNVLSLFSKFNKRSFAWFMEFFWWSSRKL